LPEQPGKLGLVSYT